MLLELILKKIDSLINLNNVPFNAKIGLFGHEFSHFIDYSNRNVFSIIKCLLFYSNQKQQEIYEKQIDTSTIYRNLGWQLYDWSYFVLNESDAKRKYKEFKKDIYLEPEEILDLIKKTSKNN